MKSILASGLIKLSLIEKSVHQFLTFLWVPDPNTLFAGIKTGSARSHCKVARQ